MKRYLVTVIFFNLCVLELTSATEAEYIYQETIAESGFVFDQGRWVTGPYTVAASENAVFVNGQQVREFAVKPVTDNSVSRLQDQENREPERRGLGRRRRPARRRAAFGARINQQTDVVENRSTDYAKEISNVLSSGGAILYFAEHNPVLLMVGDRMNQLARALTRASDDASEEFVLGLEVSVRNSARTWLDQFQPPPELNDMMHSEVTKYEELTVAAERRSSAIQWLDRLSYPLTIIGMMLGVFAFGHTLKWAATSLQNTSPLNARFTTQALFLMAGMSVLDLVWTMAAYYSGMMREVNPVASQLAASPVQLVSFKLIATALGMTILYAWRNRQQIQQAAWWMCLVCVLLTFRWVIFDSVLN